MDIDTSTVACSIRSLVNEVKSLSAELKALKEAKQEDPDSPPSKRPRDGNVETIHTGSKKNLSEDQLLNLNAGYKALERYVQTQYHLEQWYTLHSRFVSELSSCFAHIQPPQPSSQLMRDLAGVKQHTSSEVARLIQSHLDSLLASVQDELGHVIAQDTGRMIKYASSGAARRLGQYTAENQRRKWINEGAKLIGTLVLSTASTSAPAPSNRDQAEDSDEDRPMVIDETATDPLPTQLRGVDASALLDEWSPTTNVSSVRVDTPSTPQVSSIDNIQDTSPAPSSSGSSLNPFGGIPGARKSILPAAFGSAESMAAMNRVQSSPVDLNPRVVIKPLPPTIPPTPPAPPLPSWMSPLGTTSAPNISAAPVAPDPLSAPQPTHTASSADHAMSSAPMDWAEQVSLEHSELTAEPGLVDPWATSPPNDPPANEFKQLPKPTHSISASGVHLYRKFSPTDKNKWTPRLDGKPLVVLGDSQLQHVSPVPANWEIHSLSGGLIRHITGALRRIRHTVPYTVVVMVGFNHRQAEPSKNTEEINALSRILRDLTASGNVRRAFAVGVSAPVTMPVLQRDTLAKINLDLRSAVGDADFVPAIPSDKARMMERDPIHYSHATIAAIMDSIVRRVQRRAPWTQPPP